MDRSRTAFVMLASVLEIVAACHPLWAQDGIRPEEAHVAAAEGAITEGAIRGHIRFLADDLLEGRGPGSRGDELAQRYIAAQYESLGFKPAAPGGGWFQSVPLVGVTAHVPATLTFGHGNDKLELKRDEYDESWDLRGAVDDVRLLFYVGLQVAQRPELP